MTALLVVIPLAAVILLNLPFMARRASLAYGVAAVLGVWQACLALGVSPDFWLSGSAAAFLHISGEADNLARVMFLAIAVVGLASLLVALASIGEERLRFYFANLFLLAMAGMNGMVLAEDLFSLYVFLEATSAASFVLIALERRREALEGAFKYIVLSAVATVMILAAIAIFFMLASTLDFGCLGQALRDKTDSRSLAMIAVGLLCAGLCVKSGLAPFHGWLPDAYASAPAATSVLLAGIITKTTGVYALVRVATTVFAGHAAVAEILLAVGAISMVAAALAALGQSDFKRLLAYSSISQVGYIILGIAAGNAVGLAGAIFHLFNHAVFKSLLFTNAAAVEAQTGKRDMYTLGGLAERMPWTGATSVIAALSTAGVPPLAGFWSKLLIIIGLWQAGHTVCAALAVVASVITLAYLLYWQRRIFFGKIVSTLESVREADDLIVTASCALAAITVAVGLLAPWCFETFLLPIKSIL